MTDLPAETWTVDMPAPSDSRFSPDAFDEQIGCEILITRPGPPPVTTTRILKAAVVSADGASAQLTLQASGQAGDD